MSSDRNNHADETNPPLVSIVTPVYNAEDYLAETIESVLAQSFTGYELLLLDDGSTDKSIEIAERYAAQDDRIKSIRLDHGGVVPAMNRGIEVARGPWIARIDADDLAAPDRLEKQLEAARRMPEVAVIGTYSYIIGESGKIVGQHQFGPTSIEEFHELRETEPIYLIDSSVMYRRDVALEVGGYREESLPAEDLDMWTRIADDHSIIVVPEPLTYYRIHGNSISTTKFVSQLEATRRVRLNMFRRRSGLPELSSDEFAEIERNDPALKRIRRYLAVKSQHLYRQAGGLLAAGHPKGMLLLLGSIAVYPPVPLRRLKYQGVLGYLPRPFNRRTSGRNAALLTGSFLMLGGADSLVGMLPHRLSLLFTKFQSAMPAIEHMVGTLI